jgi:hypothetical protein
VGEADLEALKPTHRKAGDCAIVAVVGDVIFGFDAGKNFGKEGLSKEIGVAVDGGLILPDVEGVQERHISVGERHNDDHRFNSSLS